MLAKKIGGVLLFRLKLYKLIKILTLPLIVLSLVLPFTGWNFNQARQKYEFQEPSLRTKIFDLDYQKQRIQQEISYESWGQGVKGFIFRGKLINECILLTYPESISQQNTIKILHSTLENDKNLAKNVVLLSYQNISSLKNLFRSYINGEKILNFGMIRIALNINSQVRNRGKGKEHKIKAFFEIYGKEGLHADVDNFQSIKQLLERLHIEWSPCEQIHQNLYLKQLKRLFYDIIQHLGGSRSRISLFFDHLLCQGYRSTNSEYERSHEVLMEFGFQSSSVKFLTDESGQQSGKMLQNGEKMAKFSYSFIKEYSMQQSHLHSSSTFFYPISNNHYLSSLGTVHGGVILFVVGIVNVIGCIVENISKVSSTASIFNLIEIVMFGLQYKLYDDLSISLAYIAFKLICKLIISLIFFFRKTQVMNSSLEYLLLTGFSLLTSLYLCIFNFSLFYLSAFLSALMMTRSKTIIILLIAVSIILITMGLSNSTIKSQSQSFFYSSQNAQQTVINSVQMIYKIMYATHLEVKIVIISFIYGVSTFLI